MKKEKKAVNNCVQIDPILLLMQEHEEGMKYLKRLGTAADYIHSNGFSFEAFKDVAEAIHFIDNDFRRHHDKEERHLFPLVASHASENVEPMRDEHRELWKAFKNLRECVKEVEEMKIYPTTVRDLVRLSRSIVELLTNHITKEDEEFFPLAKNVLTKDEYALLTREINAAPSIDLQESVS